MRKMTNTIIPHLQAYLGANIEKINPNTQAVDDTTRHHQYDLLAQAAIPAVLVAYYKYTRTAEGANFIVDDAGRAAPLNYLLGDNSSNVIQRVADYASVSAIQSQNTLHAVADETVRFVKNELGSTYTADHLQRYFAAQRQSILSYLPEDLQMGELLNDSTMDDRTNKMEGPISGLAQSIQNLFSSPGAEKK
jgi:hypothetical protein